MCSGGNFQWFTLRDSMDHGGLEDIIDELLVQQQHLLIISLKSGFWRIDFDFLKNIKLTK